MDSKTEGEKIDQIASRLCDDYKSHTYEISRREARELGLPVKYATPAEEDALLNLWKFYMSRPVVPPTQPPAGQKFRSAIAWLESSALQQRADGLYEFEKDGKLKYHHDNWVVY
jgi:hypothetical protein